MNEEIEKARQAKDDDVKSERIIIKDDARVQDERGAVQAPKGE